MFIDAGVPTVEPTKPSEDFDDLEEAAEYQVH